MGAEAALEKKSSAAGGDNSDAAGGKSGAAGSSAKGGAGGAAGKGASGAAGKAAAGGSAGKSSDPAGSGGSKATGGSSGSAGAAETAGSSGTGGTATGGGTTGNAVPGYWTSKEWHGCSWTGVGEKGASTITPKDFTQNAAGAPYCAKGTVGKDPPSGSYTGYGGVALVGFNISEASPASCVSTPVDKTKEGPPAVSKMQGTGIAANIVKPDASNNNFTFRVQIQGPKGHMDGTDGANDCWCAPITKTQGKVFIPYTDFWTECWGETDAKKGKRYNGEPIDAVVFTVPGKDVDDVPYEFCVNGVAYGDSEADAPDGTAVAAAEKGTIGGEGKAHAYDRVKVTVDGEEYIVQNNNWGNETSSLVLNYSANSFKITTATGSGDTKGPPASFPSIFIGANGNVQGGQYSTSGTDNLPRQVSGIKSVISTFQYSGTSSGVYNAAYDIWFSASKPEPGSYTDAISGFVMIWLREPRDAQPIGTKQGSISIANKTWNIWVGTRGGGGANKTAPVVSFVNTLEDQNDDSRSQDFVNVDILQFIKAAADKGIPSSWYLTDVFAGFEIWSGGQGLSHDKFTCVVTPN